MGIPLIQQYRVAKYLLTQKLRRNRRYPLVLMLEPLFQCNLECAGCGKIDYPQEILAKRISYEDAMAAVDECDAPIVSIPGGEPLIHDDMPRIVQGIIARKKFVYLCTNALLLSRKLHLYEPSPYLTLSIHLDGLEEHHDEAVCRTGVFKRAVKAIREALDAGFRVNINCTLFANEKPEDIADFFDFATDLGVEGITVSPGYEYQHAPRQDVFLGRRQTKRLFRNVFAIGRERRSRWPFNHSGLYLDFLAGNRTYACTPWSNPTYNVFGWQKPCYLLVDEGYAGSFGELLETTEWNRYGTGNNPKCNNCMAHCGYEGTAVEETLTRPLAALNNFLFGPKLTGPIAPELPLAPEAATNAAAKGTVAEVSLDQIGRSRALDDS
ncbi:MAG: adenosyl-hopene transferase HpnH [Gammaproteobacteria bacterium]|nr:adenosyl-hopene transferase HpnH [Gammaproteobacteria bacterium]